LPGHPGNKTGLLFFDIKRLGLEDGATYTVSIEALNDAIDSVSPPISFSDLEILETSSSHSPIILRKISRAGCRDYLLIVDNGLISFADTIHKFTAHHRCFRRLCLYISEMDLL